MKKFNVYILFTFCFVTFGNVRDIGNYQNSSIGWSDVPSLHDNSSFATLSDTLVIKV